MDMALPWVGGMALPRLHKAVSCDFSYFMASWGALIKFQMAQKRTRQYTFRDSDCNQISDVYYKYNYSYILLIHYRFSEMSK